MCVVGRLENAEQSAKEHKEEVKKLQGKSSYMQMTIIHFLAILIHSI